MSYLNYQPEEYKAFFRNAQNENMIVYLEYIGKKAGSALTVRYIDVISFDDDSVLGRDRAKDAPRRFIYGNIFKMGYLKTRDPIETAEVAESV